MPDTPSSNSRLVYSTDSGRVKLPPAGLTNRKLPAVPGSRSPVPGSAPADGVVRIQRDKKGRGGKTATTVTGLPGSEAELDALLRSLKQHCATGGSREDRTLILQGDQREKLLAKLVGMGMKAKLAGG